MPFLRPAELIKKPFLAIVLKVGGFVESWSTNCVLLGVQKKKTTKI